jgi:hypothetical protein
MHPSWLTAVRGGESIVNGLDASDLNDVLLPCIFAILAACSWAAFLPNHLACVNVVFSHAKVSY